MTDPTKVTLATATGPIWYALVVHFAAGLVGLVAGTVAVVTRKGGALHRQSGNTFVVAMVMLGVTAVGIGLASGRTGNVLAGAITAYFVITALTAFKPIGGNHRSGWAVLLLAVPCVVAVTDFYFGAIAMGRPNLSLNGVPGPMILFLGTMSMLAAVGDVKLLRAGEITGSRRVARHLWRMCFALFIASGSFFLGQMKFLPQPLRVLPVLMLLGVAPLFLLVYWMWRVRLRHRLQGLEFRQPVRAG